MKGWSGNHGNSPTKNYKKGYYGDSPNKKTWKEAYKSMKSDPKLSKIYGNLSEAEYIAEAKRQKAKHAETGKWDAPKKPMKTSSTKTEVKTKTVQQPSNVYKEGEVKTVPVTEKTKKQTKTDKKIAKAVSKGKLKKAAKISAVASQPGTSKLEKRLNYAGEKARKRKALRQEKKERKQNLKKQVSSSSRTDKEKKEWLKTGKKNIRKDIRSRMSKI